MTLVVQAGQCPAYEDGLLLRAATGDQAAFAHLYDVTAPRVLGLIRQYVTDPAAAEVVAQKVFLEVWKSAIRFDPAEGPATAFIYSLAHRSAVKATQVPKRSATRHGVSAPGPRRSTARALPKCS